MKINAPLGSMHRTCISKVFLVMKLTLFFLLAALLHVNADTFGQKVSLKLNNAPLEKVFEEITNQTGYSFLYNDNLLKRTRPVSLALSNAALSDALDKSMAGQPVTYTISQNTIVIKKRTAPVKSLVLTDVSGKVVDKQGAPLPGVSVKVKGTVQTVTTGTDGTFRIKSVDPESVLVFSYIGFTTQEIQVGDKDVLNVTLQEEPQSLREVVITGYGQQSRRTITAAIAKVDGKSIGNQPVGTPGEALAGLASGITVTSDQGAKPGAPPTIRIRGVSSLGSSNDPLYVVDGYPLQSAANFTLINPTDIESIEILKDAASAAIYGSRAANGVVLVSTKRGKAGKTVFSLSTYAGAQSIDKYLNTLGRDEAIAYAKNISVIRGLTYPSVFDTDPGSLPDVNWQHEIFRVAPVSDVEFNASGGSEKVRFNASTGYFKQKGVLIGTDYSRYNVRLNLDADLIKNVKFGVSIAPSYAEQFRQPASGQFNNTTAPGDQLAGVPGLVANYVLPSPLNQAMVMSPVIPVYRSNGDFAEPYDRALNYNLSPSAVFFPTNYINPLNVISQAINRNRAYRSLGNAFVEWSLFNGLKLKTYLGATLENELNHAYVPATLATGSAPTASFSTPSLNAIYASDNIRNSFDWVWENTATYDKTIGDHHFNILGLFSAQKYTSQINYTAGVPGTFITTAVQSPLASPNTVGAVGYDANDFISYAGRLNYDFKEKYLLTAAIRQDGSSRFGPNNRFAVFPSFSVGWRLSEEPFLKTALDKLKINELKIRGGYGKTGNANIGSFTYVNSIGLNNNYASGSVRQFGTQQTGFANPDLTWEKNEQTDFGLDIGLLNSKINLTADYFVRNSTGMLLNKALPSVVGYATFYKANLGDLRNRGFEFGANTDFMLGNVRWTVNANLSTYKTKVMDLGGPSSLPAVGAVFGWNNVYQVKVGEPLGLMYGYTVTGVFKNAADLANNPQTVSGNRIGDWMVKDQDGSGKIDANDVTAIGHGLPDFTYGMSNSFQYKNLDLSILLQGVQGVSLINGNLRQLTGGFQYVNTLKSYYNNYFDPAQPDRDVEYPLPNNTSTIGTTNALVQKDVENGSYLRVRNITLGYRLTENMAKKVGLKSARIYVTGQNPILFTKYTGYNPEASVNQGDPTTPGIDQGAYPAARTFILGLNLGF